MTFCRSHAEISEVYLSVQAAVRNAGEEREALLAFFRIQLVGSRLGIVIILTSGEIPMSTGITVIRIHGGLCRKLECPYVNSLAKNVYTAVYTRIYGVTGLAFQVMTRVSCSKAADLGEALNGEVTKTRTR